MTNKVKFGLLNVHYALLTLGEEGVVSYGTPQPIPGAVTLSLAAQGDTETFYADNMAYFVSTANDGYQGDLEMALIPDDFRQSVLGDTVDNTAKVLVEHADAIGKPFALLYEVKGDQSGSRRLFYHCSAARPSEESATTTKSRTPSTEKLTLTCSPLPDGRVKAKTTADTPQETYNGWFATVWQPAGA